MALEREWGQRDRRKCTTPTKCRSCHQDILWAVTRSGKKMPVDAVADMRPIASGGGQFVLALHGGEYGELKAEKWQPEHGEKRNRYTSHFASCKQAGDWRKE